MFSKHRFPNDKNGYIFGNNSWVCILNGMNYLPHDPFLSIPADELDRQLLLMKQLRRFRTDLKKKCPRHSDYIDSMGN